MKKMTSPERCPYCGAPIKRHKSHEGKTYNNHVRGSYVYECGSAYFLSNWIRSQQCREQQKFKDMIWFAVLFSVVIVLFIMNNI